MKRESTLTKRVIGVIVLSSLEELARLNVKTIARKLKQNVSYMSTRFKKDTNMTVNYYIHFRRALRAEDLIRQRPDLRIIDISRMLGYCKSQYFRNYFKKIMGFKPSLLRKTFRDLDQKGGRSSG
jgi:AraC-like DNA-binding protein